MDFYVILGLERGATLNDVKRAFRRLARKYHPDINPGDRVAAAHFEQISQAYETLSDPERRRRYDMGPSERTMPAVAAFGFEGFDFSVSVSGAAAPTFGDLFADVFQPPALRRDESAPERGADIHHTLTLTFADSMTGGRREITVTRQDRCRRCGGAGTLRSSEVRCAACHGAGVVKSTRGHMVFSKPCGECLGTGRRAETKCPACAGRQTEIRAEIVAVNLPAGLADGARVRLSGQGHAGRNGGEYGDLMIAVQVEADPVFRRDGNDVHIVLPIGIDEAALGAKVEVPTFDVATAGRARVRIPPGTQSGQRFRVRERGAPEPRGGVRGDLVVEVRIVLPSLLDERSKELLREFGRLNAAGEVRQRTGDGLS
jgi:molecular chaperone DnaJ